MQDYSRLRHGVKPRLQGFYESGGTFDRYFALIFQFPAMWIYSGLWIFRIWIHVVVALNEFAVDLK